MAGEMCWGGVSGRCVGKGMMLECGRRAGGRQLAPLYYPDTLVNLDTCLGVRMSEEDRSQLGFSIVIAKMPRSYST